MLDGADEKMLGKDDEALALKSVEVKFITGSQNPNGDAKIDIGSVEKVRSRLFVKSISKFDWGAINKVLIGWTSIKSRSTDGCLSSFNFSLH